MNVTTPITQRRTMFVTRDAAALAIRNATSTTIATRTIVQNLLLDSRLSTLLLGALGGYPHGILGGIPSTDEVPVQLFLARAHQRQP
jgi:hypothetical protein